MWAIYLSFAWRRAADTFPYLQSTDHNLHEVATFLLTLHSFQFCTFLVRRLPDEPSGTSSQPTYITSRIRWCFPQTNQIASVIGLYPVPRSCLFPTLKIMPTLKNSVQTHGICLALHGNGLESPNIHTQAVHGES